MAWSRVSFTLYISIHYRILLALIFPYFLLHLLLETLEKKSRSNNFGLRTAMDSH